MLPSVGLEFEGIGEESFVAVHGPLGDEEGGFGRHAVAGDFDGALIFAAEGPCGREEAHGFCEDSSDRFQLFQVGGVWLAIAEDLADMFAERVLLCGILCEEVEGEGHCVGGGFMAGGEDGDGLVADLLVGEAGGLVVGG